MSLTNLTNLGTAGVDTGGGNPVITTGAVATAGTHIIGVIIAKDNAAAADGTTSEITSVIDSAGNTYVSGGRFCNAQGAANAGTYVEFFYTPFLTSTLANGGTITVSKSTDVDCAIAAARVTVTSGCVGLSAAAIQTLANDGADAGSMTISGLASLERLYLRAIGLELENATNITASANFTALQGTISSTAGLTAANQRVCGEFRINTSTGETSDPTLPVTTGDVASIFLALEEVHLVLPGLVTNDQTFFAPTVAPGAVALTPALVTNSQTFYAPTVSPGPVGLTPGLITNSQTFFAPAVASTYALTPGLVTNSQTFYAPTVAGEGGDVELTPGLFTNAQTFYAPTAASTYGLTPSLVTNSQSFFSPSVDATYALTPLLVTNTQTFHSPTVSSVYDLAPSLLTNAQTFYAPSAVVGAVDLKPGLFTNAQEFFAPTISVATLQDLTAGLFVNTSVFYGPVIAVAPMVATGSRPGGLQGGFGRAAELSDASRPTAGAEGNRSNRQSGTSRNNSQSGSARRH